MKTVLLIVVLMFSSAAAAGTPQSYREEMLTLQSGAISIACTLTVPAGGGAFPAVVLVSGSGPQNRDSEVFGFRPFKLIADSFAERGLAALRCDDRGVGGSTGSVTDATSEDFADDVLAGVQLLRSRAEIDSTRVGILGHSEGAIVGAIAASRSSHVAFLVWMAGSAVPGGEILRLQAATFARASGASDDAVREILRHHAGFMAALAADAPDDVLMVQGRALFTAQTTAVPTSNGTSSAQPAGVTERLVRQNLAILRSPWMRFFINFDPVTALRSVRCPVFAAFGGLDLQVPAPENRTRLEAALVEAQNQEVTVRVYQEANHLFMPAITGQIGEYQSLPRAFVPTLLDDIATWIPRR